MHYPPISRENRDKSTEISVSKIAILVPHERRKVVIVQYTQIVDYSQRGWNS